MSNILPKGPLVATRINPKIVLFYGLPKIGKTTMMAQLPGHLLLDLEKGAEAISATRVPITSIDGGTMFDEDGGLAATSLDSVYSEILEMGMAEYQRTGKRPRPPYKYIVIDTIDKLEDFCEILATKKYKNSVLGKKFEEDSVLQLPNGGGYYYLRNEVIDQINRFASICDHLILVSHVREKQIDKGGIAVETRDISLAGKLAKMVCAKADAIGYMYRLSNDPTLMVNFQSSEGAIMGSRFEHLAGQRFAFGWDKIFLPEPVKEAAAPAEKVA